MKFARTALPCLLFAMVPVAAFAAGPGPYIGGQVSQFDYKENGFDGATPTAIGVIGGFDFTPNFAIEVRAGTGVASDSVDGIDIKLKSYATLALRGNLPVSDTFRLFGLVGSSTARLRAAYQGAVAQSSDNGFSYGFGVEFLLGPGRNLGLSAEWTRLLSNSDYDLDQLGIGLVWHL